MATAHGSTTHLPTGPMATTAAITADEVQEYERILKISDQIFAGSHPRLRVPQQFVRKPTARNGQNGSASSQAVKNKPPNAVSEQVVSLETPTQSPHRSQGPVTGNPPSAAARIAPKPTSEIDPIFLTKSDDLVRAELQLQRQRLERTLRDQTELQKQEQKQKLAAQDTKPPFNVSEVLNRALQITRPVSMGEQPETSAPNDSFDENSFYSSRAPDSTPPLEEQRKASPVALVQVAGTAAHAPVEPYADELQRLEALNRSGSDQEMQDAYPVADPHAPYSQKQPLPGQDEAPYQLQEPQQIDSLEEPEYSPPAPIAPPLDQRAFPYQGNVAGNLPRPRHSEQARSAQQLVSPSQNVKVVRNHITSPAAPRPSRVSPLATAKVPSVQQLRDERPEHESDRIYSDPDSGCGSPNVPAPHIVSRKRRRLQEVGEGAQVSSRRRDGEPAEAFIKEEPVSPPPFADDPATIRNRPTQDRPVYIDIASPQYTPVLERQQRPTQRPIYETGSYHEVPVEQGPPRAISSRMGTRRPIRDDGDLRRVASMQYASRSEYPREYMPVDPNGGRAASYSVMERPPLEHSNYYEEVPHYGPRYVAVDEMSQPVYREPYYEEAPPQRVMAARRRIVDEHGIEYEEVIPAHRMQTMAPPPRPMSRVPRVEAYDDRVPVRAPSVRAQSVAQDPYVERRYVQEMAPPQYYRRVPADYARPVANDRRAYAAPLEGGHEPYPRSGSVQVAEYLPRHSTYVDEHPAPPSERGMRTASVRPQLARYEEPHDIPQQRVGSIRPGPSRDVSVVMDDRLMGDYIERPYYVRERRFYDGEDGNRVALDGAADSVQRMPRHY